jgi:hypothetical protein
VDRAAETAPTINSGMARIMSQLDLERKYYREAARVLFWVLNLMRAAQKDIDPKLPFIRAMNHLEDDLLLGLRKRFCRIFQAGASPAVLKEFERLIKLGK